jgi:hypothetical protein
MNSTDKKPITISDNKNWGQIIIGGNFLFFFSFILSAVAVGLLGIFGVGLALGILGASFYLFLAIFKAPYISGTCPHCESDINLNILFFKPTEPTAINCKMCQKRVIIKDNHFNKIN